MVKIKMDIIFACRIYKKTNLMSIAMHATAAIYMKSYVLSEYKKIYIFFFLSFKK